MKQILSSYHIDTAWTRLSQVAAFAIITLVLSACGGVAPPAAPSSPSSNATPFTLNGSVGDGPITGASLVVRNVANALVGTGSSNAQANYSITVNVTEDDFPLIVESSSGIDLVTGEAPEFKLISIAMSPNQRTVNINPHSTLIYKIASQMPGGLTAANVAAARAIVMNKLNFGMDSSSVPDPISSTVDGSNVAMVIKASEALSEMIRRTTKQLASAGWTNADDVITAMAGDLVDGVLDGQGAGSHPRVAAVGTVVSGSVLVETINNNLKVNGTTATTTLDGVIRMTTPSAPATASTQFVAINSGIIQQAKAATTAAAAISPAGSFTSLTSALAALTPGTLPADIAPLDESSFDRAIATASSATLAQIEPVNESARGTGNHAPAISGTPATTIPEDSYYSFTPAASDADNGDQLSFSISNKPSWASFDALTGILSGTPVNANVGSYNNIQILVSDSSGAVASLPPFNLTVTNTNDAPTISGNGAASISEGDDYYFVPSASDPDVGDNLTFSISNKPSWAVFDPTTGELHGTPSFTDAGTYSGIVIFVSDGTVQASSAPFSIAVADVTGMAAADDLLEVVENTPDANKILNGSTRTLDVLANDLITDPSVHIASASGTTSLGGSVAVNASGDAILYTPPAGAFASQVDVFDYIIQDGTGNTSTGTVTVDLQSICILTSVLCVGPGEEFNTNIPNEEIAFQAAADAAKPGDIIKIRGGTYLHNQTTTSTNTFLHLSNSGTASNPITVEPFDGEHVHIKGFGFPEGTAGPSNSQETLILITGNYVHVRNLELSNATKFCIDVSGNYGLVEELVAHDSWRSNVVVGGQTGRIEGNVLRYIESYRSRHESGIFFERGSANRATDLLTNNRVEYALSYHNGYQPDGQKVPIVTGDTEGGGNSDGVSSFKNCNDLAGTYGLDNMCPANVLDHTIVWHNSDDGIDLTFGAGSYIQNNISFDNGPMGNKGFKTLRYVVGGVTMVGNIAMSNDDRGFENRAKDELYFYHNVATGNAAVGIKVDYEGSIAPPANQFRVYNSLSTGNVGNDFAIPNTDIQANWSGTSQGNPELTTPTFTAASVDTNFPAGLTVAEKYNYIYSQFRTAFTPKLGSPLIDAGKFIPGIHCTTADDDAANPMPIDAKCRHWRGTAPDIGAFEY